MPAIGDLDRVRGAVAGSLGVGAGPVPADDLRAGMRFQPRLERCRLPVWQQVHRVPGVHIHQHGPVDVPLAQREVIDPQDVRGSGDLWLGQRGDQAQHGGRVHGDPEGSGQPGACPAS